VYRKVVCISRVTGAGGEQVGRLVAEKLAVRYLDEEIIAEAAAKGGVSPADVADAERRRSLLSRVLSELGSGHEAQGWAVTGIAPPVGGDERAPALLQSLIVDVVNEVAGGGDIVIGAHGASFALAGRPDVLRVHIAASSETRARRLVESAELTSKAAEKQIRESDQSRADYLRRFFGIESELPIHYDVVVNTDTISYEEAAELIALAAR
jgi:Cytidylate kinase-like family